MILQCFGGPAAGRVIEVPDGFSNIHFPHRDGEYTYVVDKIAVDGEFYRVAVWKYATEYAVIWRLLEIRKVLKFLCGWNLQTA